jgi:hypothetical protein
MFFALNGALLDASIPAWEARTTGTRCGPSPPSDSYERGGSFRPGAARTRDRSYIKGEDWIPYRPPNEVRACVRRRSYGCDFQGWSMLRRNSTTGRRAHL